MYENDLASENLNPSSNDSRSEDPNPVKKIRQPKKNPNPTGREVVVKMLTAWNPKIQKFKLSNTIHKRK